MHFKKTGLCLATILSSTFFQVQASEFDDDLQSKQIIDQNFKIKQPETLNEILTVLTAEDSTIPSQLKLITTPSLNNLIYMQTVPSLKA